MPSRSINIRKFGAVASLACMSVLGAFAFGGCATHKRVAQAPAPAPVLTPPTPDIRPMTIAPDTDASPPQEIAVVAPPSVPTSTTAPALNIPPAAAAPPPRRTPAPVATAENNEQDAAAHPPAPHIAPQLSPGDQQAFQKRIDDYSAVAEKNLQSASNRQLNPTQQDLAGKIRSFLDQARDAGKAGDWARAENLAQKARELSDELVNSL